VQVITAGVLATWIVQSGHGLIAWPFRFGRNSQRNGTHRDT
jgi:hypothetical protein